MKKYWIASCFVFFSLIFSDFINAQEKVNETSHKSAPEWINGVEDGFIITSGEGPAIDIARQQAMRNLRFQVAESVALRVKTETTQTASETVIKGAVQFFDSIRSTSQVNTPDLPTLSGLSVANAKDFYWVEMKNKKEKTSRFIYHLKYPFSASDQKKLIEEYLEMERVKNQMLYELISSIPAENKVDKLLSIKQKLKDLLPKLNPAKAVEANEAIREIESVFNAAYLKVINNRCGELTFALRSGNRYLVASGIPKINTNCADISAIDVVDFHYVITYSYDYCYKNEQNFLDISFKLSGNRVQDKITFDITEFSTEIFIKDPVFIKKTDDGKLTVDFSIRSKYAAPFSLTGFEIEVPGFSPIVVNNLDKQIEGTGKQAIQVEIDYTSALEITENDKGNQLIKGSVFYIPAKNGGIQEKRFYNIPLKVIK